MKTNIENPRSKTKSRKHPEFCIPEFCGDSTHVFSSTRTAAFVRILVSASSIMRVGTSSTYFRYFDCRSNNWENPDIWRLFVAILWQNRRGIGKIHRRQRRRKQQNHLFSKYTCISTERSSVED
jgi:hypothetical protein